MNKILITVLGLLFTNCLVGQNSIYDKLLGKWISKEDKLYSIEFKDGYFVEKSGNNIIEEGKLILSQDCTDENNINVGENEKYININGELCLYYVIYVDTKSLKLSVVGRGNELNFNKQTKK